MAELGRSNVTVLRADGANGWPPAAPFDVIIVAAGAEAAPDAIKAQLGPGGRLVALEGPEGEQRLIRVTRAGPAGWREEDLGPVALAALEEDG